MLLLEAAGAQHGLVNSQEQDPAPTPTHARFALKSCAGSSPRSVSMTNTHREVGARAQLLPGPSTFQLFHNLGNVRRNQSEILGPFTPRGLTPNRIYITNTELFWGEGGSAWAIFVPDVPPQEAPTELAKLWSFEWWRFNRGEFPRPFTQCNYSNKESSPTGLSSTAGMFVAEKISGIKPTPKIFLSENPFIHKAIPLFYSITNPMNKSKIAILHFSHTSFFFPPPQKRSKSAAKNSNKDIAAWPWKNPLCLGFSAWKIRLMEYPAKRRCEPRKAKLELLNKYLEFQLLTKLQFQQRTSGHDSNQPVEFALAGAERQSHKVNVKRDNIWGGFMAPAEFGTELSYQPHHTELYQPPKYHVRLSQRQDGVFSARI